MSKEEWDKTASNDYPYSILLQFFRGEDETVQQLMALRDIEKIGLKPSDILVKPVSGYGGGYSSLSEVCFKTFSDFANYRIKILKDFGESEPFFQCTIDFPDGLNTQWLLAAKTFLLAANIKHENQALNNQVAFRFKLFTEMAAFRLAVENNEIEHLVNALDRAAVFCGKQTPVYRRPKLTPYEDPPI